MDCVKVCAEKLGLTIIDRQIVSRSNDKVFSELTLVTRVCAQDRTKIFVISDEHDMKRIQMWHAGFGSKAVKCDTIFFRGNIIYYVKEMDKTSMHEWELLFTKGVSMECVVCREDLTISEDAYPCHKCHAMMCAQCNWKVHKPECPVYRAFLPRTYLHHRSVYAGQIVTQLGYLVQS